MARVAIPQTPGADAVIAALGEARYVGGCVRDWIAGEAPKDIDLATPVAPEDVIVRLEAAEIKAVPTGIAHGTITAVALDEVIEVTTLRQDVSTDGRRATVAFTDDWQADAARRDFTINALYADPATGEVFDWFGGLADLDAGIVRFIGDPLQRIAEDHLRILRFFRFHARFGKGEPDAASLAACAARANDLMALSRERIAMELLALLALPDPAETVALMIAQGIFAPVLPEIADAMPLARLIAREAEQGIPPDPVRRLAALIPADHALASDVGARLKLSNHQRRRLNFAARRQDDDAADPKALAYWQGTESAEDRLLLGNGDARGLRDWMPPRFPITGSAIIARGIRPGPRVATILQAVEQAWVAEGFPDHGRVEALADKFCR